MTKLNAHKKTHMEISICTSCNKTCFGKADLIRHVRLKHKDIFGDMIKTEFGKKAADKRKSSELIAPPDVQPKKKVESKGTMRETRAPEPSKPSQYYVTTNENASVGGTTIVLKKEIDQPINFTDDELTEKVRQLLDLLVDDETLAEFGWPQKSVEDVLDAVIEQCDQVPADYTTCPDYATKIRENTKLLFVTVIDTDAIKELLNNQTIDEVIVHVLKTAG